MAFKPIHRNLLLEVEKKFNSKILNYRDAKMLSESIYDVTKIRINQQTFRRLFGIVQCQQEKINLGTLDILTQYIGYKNYQEYEQVYNSRTGILLRTIQFEETWALSKFIGISLRTDEKAQSLIYPILANTDGYFHSWIDIDYLHISHHKGLYLYYKQSKEGTKNRMFSGSLLYLAKLIENELEYNLEELGDEILKHLIEIRPNEINDHADLFLIGRLIGVCLTHIKDSDHLETLNTIIKSHMTNQNKINKNSSKQNSMWSNHNCIAHTACEYLVIKSMWNEIISLTSTYTVRNNINIQYDDIMYQASLDFPKLYHIIAQKKLYQKCLANKEELISPNKIPNQWNYFEWYQKLWQEI